jgi:hypothetical protein
MGKLELEVRGQKVVLDMDSPEIHPFESVLWALEKHKGVFHRKKVWEAVVTNIRVFQYNYETGKMEAYCLFPLADFQVLNSRRVRRSSWAGPFVYRGGVGAYAGTSSSQYVTVGTVAVLSQGKLVTKWEVQSPHDLVKFLKSAQKQVKMDLVKT